MTKKQEALLMLELCNIKGSVDYSGDASWQVLLPTKGGGYLRVGITDADVGTGRLWFDYYEGFNNEIKETLYEKESK